MRLPYRGKPIDFSKLSLRLEDFFSERQYKVLYKEMKKGFFILARPLDDYDMRNGAAVLIEGKPSKFTIEFNTIGPSGMKELAADTVEALTGWMIGRWRSLQRYEHMDRDLEFEKEFWKHAVAAIKELKET